jgi:single-strand selective monofunctional uracil DNA glycosylase
MGKHTAKLKKITDDLCRDLDGLSFSEPVTHVYNPLVYARRPHEAYLEMCGDQGLDVLFLGMNPGPWGMAQTGVPFGEIPAVRDWMGIEAAVDRPPNENPKRPIEGFACKRSEVSGRRLWGLFSERYPDARVFFEKHLAVNFCPLVFMEEGGRNRTPDKIPKGEMEPVYVACDKYLKRLIDLLEPKWAIGVGGFAEKCLQRNIDREDIKIGVILHPSPASPAANRGWAEAATNQLVELGIW